jgi:hypothetical protein
MHVTCCAETGDGADVNEVTQMAWESRGGAGRYFTTTRRTSGRRVVRTYYGSGVAGDLASSMHELRPSAPEPVQDVARSNPAAPAPPGLP